MTQRLHFIELQILQRLSKNSSQTFTQLKPKSIENNTFTYHLKKILEIGLIEKFDKKYSISLKGQKMINSLSGENGQVRQQPKISNFIICKNKDGKYLVKKKKDEPFKDLYGFIYGNFHFNENVNNSAKRELFEKSNENIATKFLGSVYLKLQKNGQTIFHDLCHVSEAIIENNNGEFIEVTINNLKSLALIPGHLEILNWSKNKMRNSINEIVVEF